MIFNTAPRVVNKIKIPIGCCFDIVTGSPTLGKKGETYCNGGLPNITMIGGRGNSFKSTISNYMTLTAASRIIEGGGNTNNDVLGLIYDTEMNYDIPRFENIAANLPHLPDNILTGEDRCWVITSPGNTVDKDDGGGKKSVVNYTADKFAEDLQTTLEEIAIEKSTLTLECMANPYDVKEVLKIKKPRFITIDSLSEFNSEKVNTSLAGNLDDSSTNTYAMKQGQFRTKFLINMPQMLSRANAYMVLIAQTGKKIDMDASMYKPKDPGDLKFLNEFQNLKGVGSKATFLTSVTWVAEKEETLKTKNSQGQQVCLYPLDGNESAMDLHVVWFKTARSKDGMSGVLVPVVVSQSEGVQPTLTEFHYLIVNGKYGISGNDRDYYLDLYPDVKLNRRNIRKLVNEDAKLRRAINITAEMHQIRAYHNHWLAKEQCSCTPQELYEGLKARGYDWNEILETRGYWLPNQYTNKTPFLSTYDLLKMRIGTYEPYFKKKEKK